MSQIGVEKENDLPDIVRVEHKKRVAQSKGTTIFVAPNNAAKNVDQLIFDLFKDEKKEKFDVPALLKSLSHCGLRYETDPRFEHMMNELKQIQLQIAIGANLDILDVKQLFLTKEQFKRVTEKSMPTIVKALQNKLVIPDWDSFANLVKNIYEKCKEIDEGEVAKHLPQLAKADADWFDVSVCTVDGQRYSLGNGHRKVTLQSLSMAFTYAIALNELGAEHVHQFVGTEPSGRAFNEICLDNNNRPHNPLINSGAVLICSLIKNNLPMSERFDFLMSQFEKLAGGEYVGFNNSVFLSERNCSDRNFALAYYLREHNALPEKVSLEDSMSVYFQTQSIEACIDSLSVMGATLANGGVNPLTGERLLDNQSCRDTLSLMFSCGMYQYSGMFAFQVGLPAKASVAGVTLLIVPNVGAFTIYSPKLNSNHNSSRGVAFCEALVSQFNFHNYDSMLLAESEKVDPRRSLTETQGHQLMNILFAAKSGDLNAIKRYVLQGMDVSQPDYDGRSVLHLAAAEGHFLILKFLVQKMKLNIDVKDRWGNTPMDDAVQFKHPECVRALQNKPSATRWKALAIASRAFD